MNGFFHTKAPRIPEPKEASDSQQPDAFVPLLLLNSYPANPSPAVPTSHAEGSTHAVDMSNVCPSHLSKHSLMSIPLDLYRITPSEKISF